MARSDSEKTNLLNRCFQRVFTTESAVLLPSTFTYVGPCLEDVNISAASVRGKLRKLNVDSAPGPDGLHPRVLRETSDAMAETWTHRSSVDSGILPSPK